jgi:hypothetical protein
VTPIAGFIGGLTAAGYLVVGLFFLRFWRRNRDGLFLAFACAFALMAANSAVPVIFDIPGESQGKVYLLRLAAFTLIILAVLRKNLGQGR